MRQGPERVVAVAHPPRKIDVAPRVRCPFSK
jgi:hypothetical protein